MNHDVLYGICLGLGLTAIIALVIFVFYLVFQILYNPFHYPYFIYNIDISGKRSPHYEDFIDMFIIEGNFNLIEQHAAKIAEWKNECKIQIEESKMKERRSRQFQECIDDAHEFQFKFTKMQTRYRTVNYVRMPYKVTQAVKIFPCDYAYLLKRKQQLEAISYQLPLRQYNIKNQRSLMTKELRKTVMERDNYTCQICGKYMPDEVGLQIDHITPVSKGGKTVLSNLQVTCSKCNSRKRDKTDYIRTATSEEQDSTGENELTS